MNSSNLSFLIIFVFLSCSKQASEKIELNEFRYGKFTGRKLINELTIYSTADSIEYIYKDTISSFPFNIKLSNSDYNALLYDNAIVPHISAKIFYINTDKIEVHRFDYDDPKAQDEEVSIFFLDKYGVIAIRNYAWGHDFYFDKEGQFDNDLFNLLQQDTSGFYGYRPPPRKIDIN